MFTVGGKNSTFSFEDFLSLGGATVVCLYLIVAVLYDNYDII